MHRLAIVLAHFFLKILVQCVVHCGLTGNRAPGGSGPLPNRFGVSPPPELELQGDVHVPVGVETRGGPSSGQGERILFLYRTRCGPSSGQGERMFLFVFLCFFFGGRQKENLLRENPPRSDPLMVLRNGCLL